jgi:hypothetical protein
LAKCGHHGIGHAITVEPISPDGMPPIVKITWPPQPTVADPRHRGRRRSDAGPSLHGIGRDQGEAVGLPASNPSAVSSGPVETTPAMLVDKISSRAAVA